ncbi:MAG: hypothetical protein JOS17DRAFT_123874 [Linnemannia elongata]|nr:MAG: hypothetical protein JOS17DRAFT_123874 [Linnemannia elongata]
MKKNHLICNYHPDSLIVHPFTFYSSFKTVPRTHFLSFTYFPFVNLFFFFSFVLYPLLLYPHLTSALATFVSSSRISLLSLSSRHLQIPTLTTNTNAHYLHQNTDTIQIPLQIESTLPPQKIKRIKTKMKSNIGSWPVAFFLTTILFLAFASSTCGKGLNKCLLPDDQCTTVLITIAPMTLTFFFLPLILLTIFSYRSKTTKVPVSCFTPLSISVQQ